MSAEVFLDTNILIYAFDPDAPRHQGRARELLAARDWFTSWQVIQEFASVALHRFKVPMASDDLRDWTDLVLWPRCRVLPGPEVLATALAVRDRTGYRLYDSLIVASALAGGATRLLTQDLEHGRRIDTLRIENPFADLAHGD